MFSILETSLRANTQVSTLAENLSQRHSLPTIVLSIDDLYLSRAEQVKLAAQHPNNPLIQHRGQPSTHDIDLGISIFSKLRDRQLVRIPAYDKSAFEGLGDRFPEEQWKVVNHADQPATKVVIFEGWCIGFRPLDRIQLKRKWDAAVSQAERGDYQGRLGYTSFGNINYINDALQKYDQLTDELDALIHLDAENTLYVYEWRLEQEAALRKLKGSGMTENQVLSFVGNYYPAYELFVDGLREGSFKKGEKAQLRLLLGRDRSLKQVILV